MSKAKLMVLIVVALVIGGLLLFGPRQYLSLEFMQSQLGTISEYRQANPVKSIAIYAAIYIIATAASIPGALVLTLVGGAIFGFYIGSLVVVVSATIGATIAFLLARYLFDDLVKQKMGDRLSKIRENFRKEGALYLFSMRLVPVFPFFAINLLMGLTSIKTSTYAIASLIGMAPGTMVFVN
ncbi:MAG: TVP38/TMEM64 family protein, partial [bacterium]